MKRDPQTGLNDAEFFSHNTVRIEAELSQGYNSIGTGFLYQFFSSNKTGFPALVTNRHVLENAMSVTLEFNPTGEDNNVDFNGRKLVFKVTEFQNGWYKHPNPNIDLAVIPMSAIINRISESGVHPFITFFRRKNFPKPEEWNGLSALEPIIMVGYLNGIWDSFNNLPVLRRGMTATHPKIDFEGRPEFLIDSAVYTGSSGSPVFLFEYKDIMLGRDLNLGKDKPRLVGILYGCYLHQQAGYMKSIPIPTVKKQIPVINIPNNLGIVIKSKELDGFISLIDRKISENKVVEDE